MSRPSPAAHCRAARAYQQRQLARGLCIRGCGRPRAVINGRPATQCDLHRAQQAARSIVHYYRRHGRAVPAHVAARSQAA